MGVCPVFPNSQQIISTGHYLLVLQPPVGSILDLTVEMMLLLHFSVHFYPHVLHNNQVLGLVLKTLFVSY